MAQNTTADALGLTAQIVAAHAAGNPLGAEALPALILSVYQALSMTGQPPADVEALTPAVPVKKSVFPDFIICLEDGKKLKMLRRHLRVSYDMTPDQYRKRWSLPSDYPMVAPSYASHHSALAKEIGLGRKAATEQPIEAVEQELAMVETPKGRTRRKASVAPTEA